MPLLGLYHFAVQPTRSRKAGQVLLASRRVGTMMLFPHYFSEEVVPSAFRRTQQPPRIVRRMFHPAGGENSGESLAGSAKRNGSTAPVTIIGLYIVARSLRVQQVVRGRCTYRQPAPVSRTEGRVPLSGTVARAGFDQVRL